MRLLSIALLLFVSACASEYHAPAQSEWIYVLKGASFGGMTESSKLPKKTTLDKYGYDSLDLESSVSYMTPQYTKYRDLLEPSGIVVQRAGRDVILIVFDELLFSSYNGFQIKPSFAKELEIIMQGLLNYKQTYVEVTGYTDAHGHANDNQRLSLLKAQALSVYFAEQGLNPLRLFINGRGETRPIAENNTSRGKALNRRIEIRISPILG